MSSENAITVDILWVPSLGAAEDCTQRTSQLVGRGILANEGIVIVPDFKYDDKQIANPSYRYLDSDEAVSPDGLNIFSSEVDLVTNPVREVIALEEILRVSGTIAPVKTSRMGSPDFIENRKSIGIISPDHESRERMRVLKHLIGHYMSDIVEFPVTTQRGNNTASARIRRSVRHGLYRASIVRQHRDAEGLETMARRHERIVK